MYLINKLINIQRKKKLFLNISHLIKLYEHISHYYLFNDDLILKIEIKIKQFDAHTPHKLL